MIAADRHAVALCALADALGDDEVLVTPIGPEARTAALCKVFERCGGCHYQHALYPAQVEMKKDVLREVLQRIGKLLRLCAGSRHVDRRAPRCGQHQETHDRIARHRHPVLRHLRLRIMPLDHFHELGRGPRMQPLLVDDPQIPCRHGPALMPRRQGPDC